MVPFLFLACEKTEDPVLTISQETVEVSADENSTTIALFANNPWTVSAPDWCTVSPKGGEGGQEVQVKVTVKKNDTYADRSGTITFTSGELTKTFSVKQVANLGVVLPQKEYKISSGAQQLEVTVKANVKYTVETTADWIRQAGTKALETTTIIFDIEENDSYEARTGLINIIDDTANDTISIEVKQVQVDAIFVSPTEFSLNCQEHTLNLEVQTNVDLDVVIPDNAKSWVSLIETKALQEKTITLKVNANEGYDPRSCEIRIKKKNEDFSETVYITQEENRGVVLAQKEFNVTPAAQNLEVPLKTNAALEFQVSENAKEWISVVETKALEEKTLVLAIAENTGYDARTGYVLVRVERSNDADTIKISQQHKDTLYAATKQYSVVREGDNIEVKVHSTVEYEVEILNSWITENQTRALNEKTHSFAVAANEDVQGRDGYIVFKSKTTAHKDTVTVNQNGQGGYIWYNGIQASKSVPGSGTEGDPYIIHTANDLQWLIDQTAYVTPQMLEQYGVKPQDVLKTFGKYYKLTHDLEIDSSEDIVDASGNVTQARGWTPIGSGSAVGNYSVWHTFAGYFDGGGHTITGKMVPVSKPVAEDDEFYFGFFGHCSGIEKDNGDYISPVIKNLNMAATVNLQNIPVAKEYVFAGAVVGLSPNGIILHNCKNSGNITGPVYTKNPIEANIGGIAGAAYHITEIENCENSGTITGGTFEAAQGGGNTGGIIGFSSISRLKNLTNTGKVYGAHTSSEKVGGIAGQAYFFGLPDVDCYALELENHAEIISSSKSSTCNIGGIFGFARNDSDATVPMRECKNTAPVKYNKYTGADKVSQVAIGGLTGIFMFTVEMTACSNSGDVVLEYLSAQSASSSFTIGGLAGGGDITMDKCTNEGDVSAACGTAALYAGGLVGYPTGYGIFNSTNTGSVTVNANNEEGAQYASVYAGGCAGYSYTRIHDCTNKGAVAVTGTPTSVMTGGIAGYSNSIYDPSVPSKQAETIKNCINEGDVTSALTEETLYAGGIAGPGFITKDCTNNGNVTTAGSKGICATGGIEGIAENNHTISGCSNSGTISGGVSERWTSYTGGIVGSLQYMSKVINGCTNSGLVKYTTAGNEKSFIGSIAGEVTVESLSQYQPVVCSCTKDTSNSGLPMIGGGYTTLQQHSECTATH